LSGKQTIAFAFSVRDDDTRRRVDKPDLANQADLERRDVASGPKGMRRRREAVSRYNDVRPQSV
jgi:hypothetical protein